MLSNILSEMMWAVSEGSSESECDATTDSVDVESLSWDNSEDLYRLYYDEDYDDDENGNHGAPKTGPTVPVSSSDEEKNAFLGFTELYWALLGALIGFIAFSH